MKKDYELFDFKELIEEIKKRGAEKEEEDFVKSLDYINEDMGIEDLPLYKDYLSKFDIKNAFDGYKLDVDPDYGSEADFEILLRLIFASFSSSYSISFDEEDKKVSVEITVERGDQKITKALSELWSFQIIEMFRIYLDEQIRLDLLNEDEDEREALQSEQKIKKVIFEKKVREAKNKGKGDKIIADLDILLKS